MIEIAYPTRERDTGRESLSILLLTLSSAVARKCHHLHRCLCLLAHSLDIGNATPSCTGLPGLHHPLVRLPTKVCSIYVLLKILRCIKHPGRWSRGTGARSGRL